MKKIFAFFSLLIIINNLNAQKGIELSANFTPGASMIFNQQDLDEPYGPDLLPRFSYNLGLTVGYNFNKTIGLATGISYSSLGQNYETNLPNVLLENQHKWSRELSYVRVPLLFRLGTDNTKSGFFLRFGPHLDISTSAIYRYQGTRATPDDQTIDYTNVTIDHAAPAVAPRSDYNLYHPVVLGLTLEIGGRVRITDHLGLLVLLHTETSLISVESALTAYYDNSNSGDSNLYSNFSKKTPSSTSNNSFNPGEYRDAAISVMAGLTIGVTYTFGL